MAEMLDRPPNDRWDGASYAATLTEGADRGHEQLVISQCCHVCQRSVRWEDWLYIRTYHDGFHLLSTEQVYNLADDPHEQTDLAGSRPDLCREGAWRLLNWHDAMMASMPAGRVVDPMRIVLQEGGPYHARGALATYCKRLEATGRGDAVAELKRRHPREFEQGRARK